MGMKIDHRLVWAAGALAGAAILLAAGAPLTTLVLLAAVLACPAAIYLGMRGRQHSSTGAGRSSARMASIRIRTAYSAIWLHSRNPSAATRTHAEREPPT